jgi:hypothetical protein
VKAMSKQNETRDYWSDCGQVYFLNGWGWGLTEKGQRISLGREEDIMRFFETAKLNGNLHPKQKEALNWILAYRKEEGFGESTSGTTGMERKGDYGTIRRKSKATRSLTSRERIPLRLPRAKNKSLSGK